MASFNRKNNYEQPATASVSGCVWRCGVNTNAVRLVHLSTSDPPLSPALKSGMPSRLPSPTPVREQPWYMAKSSWQNHHSQLPTGKSPWNRGAPSFRRARSARRWPGQWLDQCCNLKEHTETTERRKDGTHHTDGTHQRSFPAHIYTQGFAGFRSLRSWSSFMTEQKLNFPSWPLNSLLNSSTFSISTSAPGRSCQRNAKK